MKMKSISEQRRELWNKRIALCKAKAEAYLKLNEEDKAVCMTDDQYDARADSIDSEYDDRIAEAHRRWYWLQYKQSRNEWFKRFAESFGICDGRRITRKQGEIFAKYSEPNHDHDSGRGVTYYVRVNDVCVKTMLFEPNEPCYVTILRF